MSKRKKLEITWPSQAFTIQDIQNVHPDAKNITLRYRINRAKEDGLIAEIGKNECPTGRPTIVFAPAPIEAKTLQSATDKGVFLYEEFKEQLVDVAKVDSTTTTKTTQTETVAQTV